MCTVRLLVQLGLVCTICVHTHPRLGPIIAACQLLWQLSLQQCSRRQLHLLGPVESAYASSAAVAAAQQEACLLA